MNHTEKTFRSWDTQLKVDVKEHISHPTLDRLLELLKMRSWEIKIDPEVEEKYPTISKDYLFGQKGDLKLRIHRYPNGFHLEFYQDMVVENTNGGRYDFDKYNKMPYLIRIRFDAEINRIIFFLQNEGYRNTSKPKLKNAYDKVMYNIKDSCHYKTGKELPEYEIESYNATDKDKKLIRNGQIKYFRDRKGRLQRGTVYHNINNMWWVIINKNAYRNLASFELFDLDIEENRHRKIIKPSGNHNPKARNIPNQKQLKAWRTSAKKAPREQRVAMANSVLDYLYSLNWVSRKFEFYLKSNGRIGLLEIESRAWGKHHVHENPLELTLYARRLPMSNTESEWIKGLRSYVVRGEAAINDWFCTDANGVGPKGYKWPEVREYLWKIGAMVD